MIFGGLLVTMLGLAGLARADTPQAERRDFFMYLDEFQTFTTLALVNMLAELRKYGLGLVLANQFMDQIDPEVRSAILGNVGTLIVFRVGAADAQKLVKEIFPDLDFYELTLLPNRMFWIRPLVRGESKEAFTGETIKIGRPGKKPAKPVAPPLSQKKDFGRYEPEDLGN
jgi:hypothetical protein